MIDADFLSCLSGTADTIMLDQRYALPFPLNQLQGKLNMIHLKLTTMGKYLMYPTRLDSKARVKGSIQQQPCRTGGRCPACIVGAVADRTSVPVINPALAPEEKV